MPAITIRLSAPNGIHDHIKFALMNARIRRRLDGYDRRDREYRQKQAEAWHRIKDIPFTI